MAGGTIFHHPFPGPMTHGLAVGTSDPVFFLPEMALAAEGVGMIHVYFFLLAAVQKIPVLLAVTGITIKGAGAAAMDDNFICMGDFGSIFDHDLLVVVAGTALEAFYLVLSGLGIKISALKGNQYFYRIYRNGDRRFHPVVIGIFCLLYFFVYPGAA